MPKPVYKVPLYPFRPGGSTATSGFEPLLFDSTTKVFRVPPLAANIHTAVPDVRVQRMPLKAGAFRLTYPVTSPVTNEVLRWETWFEGGLETLSKAKEDDRLFVFIGADYVLPLCGSRPGHATTHMVVMYETRQNYSGETVTTIAYECDEPVKYDAREGIDFEIHRNTRPTCPECAVPRWHVLFVGSHKNPKVEATRAAKVAKVEATKEKRFLARPTRFDRVVDELPPVKLRAVAPAPETEDEPAGRDDKLAARVRQGTLAREKREQFKRERRWK